MITASNSVLIDRPPHEVFEYLCDHEHRIHWQPNLVTHEHERLEKGARVKEVRNVLGRRVEIEGEMTEFVEDRRLTFRGHGPHVKRLEYNYVLRPEGDGTRLETEMEVDLADAFGLVAPVIQRLTDRELDHTMNLLKDVLESEPARDAVRQLPEHHHHRKQAGAAG